MLYMCITCFSDPSTCSPLTLAQLQLAHANTTSICADPGPRDTPAATALRQTYFPPAGLLPYLSRGGPLFTVRTDDAEKVCSSMKNWKIMLCA